METDQPAKKAPPRWTDEEEARLTQSYLAGTPIKDIAADHERSVGAITSRLHLLDLVTYGPYTPLIAGRHPLEGPEEGAEPAANMGQPWMQDEIARLLVAHHAEGTAEALTTLAAELGRTPRSLALKLVSLGAVEPQPNPNPNPAPRPEKKPPKPKAPARLIEQPQTTQKITVTGEFQAAVKAIQAGEHLLVLGSAGTGKSTFLRYLKKQLEGGPGKPAKKYVVLAPTGMAALNVGGQTVHSFFGFKPGILDGKNLPKPRNPKLFENLDVLILDEISMVRADIFDAIDAFLRHYGPQKRVPFGGVQLCLIGDLFQLPPIVRRDEMPYFDLTYASPYFFDSNAYRQLPIGVVEFTHVFRQSDQPFVNLLTNIRHATNTAETLRELNQRCITSATPEHQLSDIPTLTARLNTAEEVNQRAMSALPGAPRTYTAQMSGNFDESAVPAPLSLTLKPGAKVMFIKNDPQQRWVNGTLGTVITCDNNFTLVRTADGISHAVEAATWERTRYNFDAATDSVTTESAGSFKQLPLAPAWALTIHKCQGQTLPGAIIDLSGGGAFAEGQLYVALSRTRSLESLYLKHPITARDVKTHPAVQQFYASLGV